MAASTASVAPAAATPAAPPLVKLPEPPPASVPDAVNPFADPDNQPQPLKWPSGARPALSIDVHPIQFDGLELTVMIMKGPDFEWQFNPLSNFVPAPTNSAESLAFIYEPRPVARVSFALFGREELLPDFTPASLVQYLASVRGSNAKNFILLTAFPKDAEAIQADGLCGFKSESVDYAIVNNGEVTYHHDWLIDLHNEHQLLVSLTAPKALMEQLKPQVNAFLNNSRVLKGLGVKETSKPAGMQANPPNT